MPRWIAVVLFGCFLAPAERVNAADQLGSAGPIRMFGWTKCDADYASRMQGACDPPSVGPDRTGSERSRENLDRAKGLIGVSRTDQAVKALEAAVIDDPRNVEAYVLRARLAIPTDITAARKNLNQALMIDPENADALSTLAYIQYGQDPKEALKTATTAISSDRNNVDGLWILSLILVRLGSFEEADQNLTRAVSLEPDEPRARLARAQLRMRMGRLAEAVEDANDVLRHKINHGALQVRATASAIMGDYARTVDDLTQILGAPGNPGTVPPGSREFLEMFVQRALAFVRLERASEARQDLDTIIRFGGTRAILQMQIYLKRHGFLDIAIDGRRSDVFDEALRTCFLNDACGRGIAIRI